MLAVHHGAWVATGPRGAVRQRGAIAVSRSRRPARALGRGSGEPVVLEAEPPRGDVDALVERDAREGTPNRADATSDASTSAADDAPDDPGGFGGWAAAAAAAGVLSLGVLVDPAGILHHDGDGSPAARSETLTTGYPAGATCGDFSAARTQVARDILTCNQDNWRENCLAHYADDLRYVDGPGLTKVFGKAQMSTYLANQFEFSRQYLTVVEETCAADTYIASWSLDMDLGTGNLRGMPGISVLKFAGDGDGVGDGDGDGGGNVVRYHRDYLPDGKIWENAPIVGPLVKFQRETYVGCMLSPGGCADLLGAPK